MKENHDCQSFNGDTVQIMRFGVRAYLKMSGPNKTWECLHWRTITSFLEPIIWMTSRVYYKRWFTRTRDSFSVKVNYSSWKFFIQHYRLFLYIATTVSFGICSSGVSFCHFLQRLNCQLSYFSLYLFFLGLQQVLGSPNNY